MLAAATAEWTATHDQDMYREDLRALTTRCWQMRATPEPQQEAIAGSRRQGALSAVAPVG